MDSGYWIWIALGALAAGGLLSSLHHAVREASRKVAEELASARPGAGGAARVRAIFDDAEGHANALGLPRTACNLLVVVATVLWIAGLRQNRAAPEWFEVVLGVGAASVLVWVVGLVIPVAVARHAAEQTVCTWAGVIRAVYMIGRPVRGLVAFLDEVARRLAGQRARDETQMLQRVIGRAHV